MLSALEMCHRAGIAHRDIKPENILLDSNFQLKVADFGLSSIMEVRSSSRVQGKNYLKCRNNTIGPLQVFTMGNVEVQMIVTFFVSPPLIKSLGCRSGREWYLLHGVWHKKLHGARGVGEDALRWCSRRLVVGGRCVIHHARGQSPLPNSRLHGLVVQSGL